MDGNIPSREIVDKLYTIFKLWEYGKLDEISYYEAVENNFNKI